MKAFQMAVKAQLEREGSEEEVEEYPITFMLGEHELKAKPATPAQMALLIGTSNLGGGASLGAGFRFLRGTLDRRSYNLILTLIEGGEIGNEMLFGGEGENEEGIVDWLMEQASDRPTPAPSDSSKSSEPGGKKSTGRSPGKGSTLSE